MNRNAFFVMAVLALVAARARAESRPTLLEDHQPGAKPAALELGLGWYMDKDSGTTLQAFAPTLGARVSLSEHAELTLDWPFAFASVSPSSGSGDSSFRTANPFVAGYYMQRRRDGYFRIGGGIAFPLAHVGRSALNGLGTPVLAYGITSVMQGWWNIWMYLPDHLSLVVPLQLEHRSGALVLGGELGTGFLLPTRSGSSKVDVAFQLAGSLGGRIDNVTIGGRLQAAWIATLDGDNAQVALVPFVQADFSGGGFVYARLLLNLDDPFGVLGSNTGLAAKVWALALGGGGRF